MSEKNCTPTSRQIQEAILLGQIAYSNKAPLGDEHVAEIVKRYNNYLALQGSLTAADARVKVLEGALKKISKHETATEYFDPIIENDFVSLMGEAKILVNQIGAIATQALKETDDQMEKEI